MSQSKRVPVDERACARPAGRQFTRELVVCRRRARRVGHRGGMVGDVLQDDVGKLALGFQAERLRAPPLRP
jgi:hypothetical protein